MQRAAAGNMIRHPPITACIWASSMCGTLRTKPHSTCFGAQEPKAPSAPEKQCFRNAHNQPAEGRPETHFPFGEAIFCKILFLGDSGARIIRAKGFGILCPVSSCENFIVRFGGRFFAQERQCPKWACPAGYAQLKAKRVKRTVYPLCNKTSILKSTSIHL